MIVVARIGLPDVHAERDGAARVRDERDRDVEVDVLERHHLVGVVVLHPLDGDLRRTGCYLCRERVDILTT